MNFLKIPKKIEISTIHYSGMLNCYEKISISFDSCKYYLNSYGYEQEINYKLKKENIYKLYSIIKKQNPQKNKNNERTSLRSGWLLFLNNSR